jgi:hypothetical protein
VVSQTTLTDSKTIVRKSTAIAEVEGEDTLNPAGTDSHSPGRMNIVLRDIFRRISLGTYTKQQQLGCPQSIDEQIGDKYSQSRNLLFIADCQVQLQKTDAAIATLQHSAAIARDIGYEPLQQFALDRIAELQQPVPASKRQFPVLFSRLRGWHYILLGVSAFILVLVIYWLTHK